MFFKYPEKYTEGHVRICHGEGSRWIFRIMCTKGPYTGGMGVGRKTSSTGSCLHLGLMGLGLMSPRAQSSEE